MAVTNTRIIGTYYKYMQGSRKFRKGGPDNIFFSRKHISQRAVLISLMRQLDLRGPIASPGRSVPEFLSKPIATDVFLEVGGGGCVPDPLSPTLDLQMK